MNGTWHIALAGGGRQGPLSMDELRSALGDGRLRPDTLVWAEGMATWEAAGRTALAGLFGPPPLPEGPWRQQAAGAGAASPVVERRRGRAGEGLAASPKGFADAVASGFRNYVTFSGRASRSEYWYWTLFVTLVTVAAGFLDAAIGADPNGGGVFSALVALGLLLPGVAMGTRRLHDIGRSGWWQLLVLVPLVGAIVLIVFYCTRPVVTATKYDA